MDIRFSGQHLEVTNGMKEHFTERLTKLDRLSPKLVEAHGILKKEKHLYKAEVTVLGKQIRYYGEGEDKENVYAAIDQAYSRVEKQVKKHRDKYKSHHQGLDNDAIPPKVVIADEINSGSSDSFGKPQIVKTDNLARKPMSAEEASMQLEMEPNPFLAFLNASTQKVNVIYKRDDGNHGLIEP